MIRKLAGFAFLCAALGLTVSLPTSSAQDAPNVQPAKDKPLHIGMVKTFFNDLPQSFVDLGGSIFMDSMKSITGLEGTLSSRDEAFEVARKLDKGELQLAVFHGHEFAWVQKKYPKLTPMVMAVNKYHDVRAYVIVHKNNPAKTLADLRGKKIEVPMMSKQHCLICLERQCTDNAQPNLKAFFGDIGRPTIVISAFNGVASGTANAVLIDTIGVEQYKENKGPTFEKHLRILYQSESFPPPVIVYKEGSLEPATFAKVRDGLLKAHLNPAATDILKMWHIESFEPIPPTYSKSLVDVLKSYPSPEATKVTMR